MIVKVVTDNLIRISSSDGFSLFRSGKKISSCTVKMDYDLSSFSEVTDSEEVEIDVEEIKREINRRRNIIVSLKEEIERNIKYMQDLHSIIQNKEESISKELNNI